MQSRVLREADEVLRTYGDWDKALTPPWQGECNHGVGLHATLESRRLDGGPRCCRCNAIVMERGE